MSKILKINQNFLPTSLIFIWFFYFTLCSSSIASTNVNLVIEGCNDNNICEPPSENNLVCSNDCNPCNYNNVCELLKSETPLSCPSDCQIVATTTPGVTGVSSAPVVVVGKNININIKTGINYAVISWDTSVPTFGSVSWGRGDSYNDGIINGTKITTHHEIIIENLFSSTTYSYFINSSLPEYYYARNTGTFKTLSIPAIKIIPSIYNLIATQSANEIILNWNNPENKDFYGVKIVRSPFFFPTDPFEGKVIYDGTGTYTRDANINLDAKYYYSAFSYDKDFNFSSGVVVEGVLKSKHATTSEIISDGLEHPKINILPVSIFVFTEEDLELALSSSTVKVYPFNDLKIFVNADRFPETIKTLILKIQDPYDNSKIYSYSFNLNSKNNYFYAVIPSLGNNIVYSFTITAYGLDNEKVSIINGFLDVKAPQEPKSYSILAIYFGKLWLIYTTISILAIFIGYLFYKRKKTYFK